MTDDPLDTARLTCILEVAPTGIAIIDSTGSISFANERAIEMLKLTHDEITDRAYAHPDWNIYDEDGAPIEIEDHPITTVWETGEPMFGFEHGITLADGTERWIVNNAAPLLNSEGEVEQVVVTFEDATALKQREEKLTSEQVRRLEIRADQSAIPPSLRDVPANNVHITVDSIVTLPDGTSVQYMTTEDLSATEFVNAVTEVPHYLDVRLLSTKGSHTHIEAHAEPATISEVFPSLGGRARAIIITDDEIRFRGELPGDVDPREAVDGVRAFQESAELVSQELVYSPHLLYDVLTDALTDRQFAALETAYYGGYFDTPRTSTGDELAERFGVTRQTFNQHLRKAERIVCQHLFEKSGKGAR